MKETYERPYTAEQIKKFYGLKVFNKLFNCPVHRWRMETGIELIHKEPSKEEFLRIVKNWKLMPKNMKILSDRKSIEIFGMKNIEHAKLLGRLFYGLDTLEG